MEKNVSPMPQRAAHEARVLKYTKVDLNFKGKTNGEDSKTVEQLH